MSTFDEPTAADTRPGPTGVPGGRRHARDGVVLALACVAQFMVVLDGMCRS